MLDADLAFANLGDLAEDIRDRRLGSAELLELYLGRIEAYPGLNAVVTLDERAPGWARECDEEAASGRLRGALHGGSVGPQRDWLEANEERVRLQARWADACADYDVILMPVTPVAALPHQAAETDDREVVVNDVPQPWRVISAWLWVVGLLHLPAAAAPVGLSPDGLPVGIQVVGRYGGDRTVIEAARRIGRYVPPPGFGAPG